LSLYSVFGTFSEAISWATSLSLLASVRPRLVVSSSISVQDIPTSGASRVSITGIMVCSYRVVAMNVGISCETYLIAVSTPGMICREVLLVSMRAWSLAPLAFKNGTIHLARLPEDASSLPRT